MLEAPRLQEIADDARSMSIEVLKFRRKHWKGVQRFGKALPAGWMETTANQVTKLYDAEIKRRRAKMA